MALITCMSEPSTSAATLTQKSNQTDEGQIQGPSGHHQGGQGGQEGSQEGGQEGAQEGGQLRCRHSRGVDDLQQEQEQEEEEEEDSGCECSVEELERMDAWTKGGIQTRTNVSIQYTLHSAHLGHI